LQIDSPLSLVSREKVDESSLRGVRQYFVADDEAISEIASPATELWRARNDGGDENLDTNLNSEGAPRIICVLGPGCGSWPEHPERVPISDLPFIKPNPLDPKVQVTKPLPPADLSNSNQIQYGEPVLVESGTADLGEPIQYVEDKSDSSYPGLGGFYLQATVTSTEETSNQGSTDTNVSETEAHKAIEDHIQKVFGVGDRSVPQIETRLIERDDRSYYVDLTIGREQPSHYVGVVAQGTGDKPSIYLRKTDLEVEAVIAILKELQVPIEQLHEITFSLRESQTSCEIPGCVLWSGDFKIVTKEDQTYRYFEGQIAKYDSLKNQEPYEVAWTEVDTPKVRYMKTSLQNDLVSTFGLNPVAVEQYLKDGLIRIELDAVRNTAKVFLDPRINRPLLFLNGQPYLAHLLDAPQLPLEIEYQFKYSSGNTMMRCVGDPVSGERECPSVFPGIASSSFHLNDGRFVHLDYLRYRHPLIPDQPVMPDSGVQTFFMPDFFEVPSGHPTIVTVFRKASACSSENPDCGIRFRRMLKRIRYEYSTNEAREGLVKALVEYFDKSQGNVAFRKVEILSKRTEDERYRIRLVTDLDAQGNIIRTSEFRYHNFAPIYALSPCHITGNCPPQPKAFLLANIERKDHVGNVLGIILGFFHKADGTHARIELANGVKHEVIFQSWDDLLNQATELEVASHLIINPPHPDPYWPPPLPDDVPVPFEPKLPEPQIPVVKPNFPAQESRDKESVKAELPPRDTFRNVTLLGGPVEQKKKNTFSGNAAMAFSVVAKAKEDEQPNPPPQPNPTDQARLAAEALLWRLSGENHHGLQPASPVSPQVGFHSQSKRRDEIHPQKDQKVESYASVKERHRKANRSQILIRLKDERKAVSQLKLLEGGSHSRD
ncbi:MAG: hypothetical protein HY584_04120, partial [Candidatus Omnitrophica bacterium]|nr:hypothetical protein [Candidatus Omnitrophota bacterium]